MTLQSCAVTEQHFVYILYMYVLRSSLYICIKTPSTELEDGHLAYFNSQHIVHIFNVDTEYQYVAKVLVALKQSMLIKKVDV